MKLASLVLGIIFSSLVHGEILEFDFAKFDATMVMEFTRGPSVLEESITHIKLKDNSTGKQVAFPGGDKSVEITLKSLDADVRAPKPEVHTNYQDKMGLMASRIFFTTGGRWDITVKISNKKRSETLSQQITLVNNRTFPKDTKSFPYVGKKAHRLVGVLGGSGCRRQWDFVDTHDSLHINRPYDLCGKYAMVSNRYHKWVDLSEYGHKVEKLQATPIEGDAVLEKITCDEIDLYQLVQYKECGGEGEVIAWCDSSGNAIESSSISCN